MLEPIDALKCRSQLIVVRVPAHAVYTTPMRQDLPVARLISDEPSAATVRWVMRSVWLAMLAFAIIVVFGHIPRG